MQHYDIACSAKLTLLCSDTLFPVVNFFKCVATEVVLFSIVAFKTLTFHMLRLYITIQRHEVLYRLSDDPECLTLNDLDAVQTPVCVVTE